MFFDTITLLQHRVPFHFNTIYILNAAITHLSARHSTTTNRPTTMVLHKRPEPPSLKRPSPSHFHSSMPTHTLTHTRTQHTLTQHRRVDRNAVPCSPGTLCFGVTHIAEHMLYFPVTPSRHNIRFHAHYTSSSLCAPLGVRFCRAPGDRHTSATTLRHVGAHDKLYPNMRCVGVRVVWVRWRTRGIMSRWCAAAFCRGHITN